MVHPNFHLSALFGAFQIDNSVRCSCLMLRMQTLLQIYGMCYCLYSEFVGNNYFVCYTADHIQRSMVHTHCKAVGLRCTHRGWCIYYTHSVEGTPHLEGFSGIIGMKYSKSQSRPRFYPLDKLVTWFLRVRF